MRELSDIINGALLRRGPQTDQQLLLELASSGMYVSKKEVVALSPHVVDLSRARPAFTNLASRTICYGIGQEAEAGLLMASDLRVPPTQGDMNTIAHWIRECYPDPTVSFTLHAHYLGRDRMYDVRRKAGASEFVLKTKQLHTKWSDSGAYILERVKLNNKLKGMRGKVTALIKKSDQIEFSYEQVAAGLGMTSKQAGAYKNLAREAGKPLRLFLIGSLEFGGYKSRLFDFGL